MGLAVTRSDQTTPPSGLEMVPERTALAAREWRARTFEQLGRARVANAWLRLASNIIVACVSVSIIGNALPLAWIALIAPIVLIDRLVYARVQKKAAAGEAPRRLAGIVAWTVFQSLASNSIAAILWFAPYVDGETLAVMYVIAGLANAATTLRGSPAIALAATGPTMLYLLALPIADFVRGGATNTVTLTPLIGGVMFIGYGINLWRSLQASDVAVAQAEVAARRERQAAAAASAAKSDTIRRMNDELRTPMAALVGAAEALRRSAVSPQARAHIGALAQAGEVLRMVLDDLSDLDKLENGQVKIVPGPCDPRDLVRNVAGAFQAVARDKNLELFLDVQPEAPSLVEIDGARVRQVLFNLLANAVRYTAHGGVRLRLQVQAAETPGRVRLGFVVADTGEGMSRSQLAMVLRRERAGHEHESGARKSGIGLAISLRLARLMGGQLGAKSEIGQGSVFSLVIEAPVIEVRAEAHTAA